MSTITCQFVSAKFQFVSMSRWLMPFLDIMYVSNYAYVLCWTYAFHCFQRQHISGNKHLTHVASYQGTSHIPPTTKYDISMEENNSFPIVFLNFLWKFSRIHVKCWDTNFLVYKNSNCMFFWGGGSKIAGGLKILRDFHPAKIPRNPGWISRHL